MRTLTAGIITFLLVSNTVVEDKRLTEVTLLSAAENTLHNLINYWRVASVRFNNKKKVCCLNRFDGNVSLKVIRRITVVCQASIYTFIIVIVVFVFIIIIHLKAILKQGEDV